jgi:hypothetical protein
MVTGAGMEPRHQRVISLPSATQHCWRLAELKNAEALSDHDRLQVAFFRRILAEAR